MAQGWQEYISKVHHAVPLDPWVTNVQLLDIFIFQKKGCSWVPWHSAKRTRIGSMLNLGDKDTKQWKENVHDPITTGLQRLDQPSDAEEVGNVNMFQEDQGMADMHASIKASTSLLASIFDAGKSAVTQFNKKGVKSPNCVVTGVKSRRVRLDALMDLVNQRGVNEPAWWRPNTWRPEFRWSSKRGQTISVVTEILYASKIRLDINNNNRSVNGTEKKSTVAKTGDVKASKEGEIEKGRMWVVTATQQKAFPFAYRTVELEYDADGILHQADALAKIAKKSSPLQPMVEELHRSASASKSTPNIVAAPTVH